MRRTGIMLCYPMEEKRLHKWPMPVLCQPKLDGNRCRCIPSQTGWTMVSSEGNEITSCPHILNELNNLPGHLWMELDGELYNHDLDHELIHGITSRTVNLHESHEVVQFHCFDIISEELKMVDRFELLNLLFRQTDLSFIKKVESIWANNLSEIMELYENFLNQSYEGIILRNGTGKYKRTRSTDIMKFKPTRTDYYKIVGMKEEHDKNGTPKGTLGSFECCGLDGEIFSVGSGLTQSQRWAYWRENCNGKYVKVQYQRLTAGKRAPIFPVFLELVDENPELI